YIDSIYPNSEKNLLTDPVLTYRSRLDGGYIYTDGSSTHKNGRIEGLWLKVYMKINGKKLVRQFSIPENLQEKKTWHTKPVAIGLN
ncbi:MAG TPA: hypothetical protein VIR77_00710, partial [Pontiella sp.]